MFNRKSSTLSASGEGILLGVMLAVLFLSGFVAHASAATYSTDSWSEGIWYSNLGTTVTAINLSFDNLGLPAGTSNGSGDVQAVLTASSDGYAAQIAILNTPTGPELNDQLWMISGDTVIVGPDLYSISSSDLNAWNNMELTLGLTQVCEGHYCYYDEIFNWILDGTTETTYTGGVGNGYFDTEMVPNVVDESHDMTTSDLTSLDIHGYLQIGGSDVSDLYLYPGGWGYGSDSCALPSGAESSGDYVGGGQEAPSVVGVTGHYWSSSYGATDEFGIGDYSSTYSPINDQHLSSNCSPLPQMA
jgi:hypothetical protein